MESAACCMFFPLATERAKESASAAKGDGGNTRPAAANAASCSFFPCAKARPASLAAGDSTASRRNKRFGNGLPGSEGIGCTQGRRHTRTQSWYERSNHFGEFQALPNVVDTCLGRPAQYSVNPLAPGHRRNRLEAPTAPCYRLTSWRHSPGKVSYSTYRPCCPLYSV